MAMLEEDPDLECDRPKRSWPLWAFCALFFILTVTIVALNHRDEVAIADKETRCPVTTASVTAVLIDVTDRLENAQKKQMREEMHLLSQAVPQNGRLDLYMLDKGGEAVLVFSRCSPGIASGRFFLAANDTKTRQIWEQQFRAKVDEGLEKAMAGEKSDTSPLVKAMKDVSAQSFSGGQAHCGNTLIIVSDMLSRTRELDQYVTGRRALSFEQYRAKPSFAATRPTNLSGVRVQVFYLRREHLGHLQTQAHKEFWREFFKACGSSADIAEI